MAMLAMIPASTYQGTGLFTPMYHIGSAFGGGAALEAMMTSMEQAEGGDAVTWSLGPAISGLAIHMVAGMMWGALFGLLVVGLHIGRRAIVAAGVAYGAAVMFVMAFIVLPVLASVSGSGDPIRNMPSMVGWGTFTAEHVLFGLVFGLTTVGLGRKMIDLTDTTADMDVHHARPRESTG